MSEAVQSIVEAVRGLSPEEKRELMETLALADRRGQGLEAKRKDLVASIQGKYSKIQTSSESFLERRREDLAREFRQ